MPLSQVSDLYSSSGSSLAFLMTDCESLPSSFTIRAGIVDDTSYVYPMLRGAQLDNDPNDIGAVAAAVLKVEQNGVRVFTAGQLAFAEPSRRREFEGVVQRGLAELGVLMRQQRVL